MILMFLKRKTKVGPQLFPYWHRNVLVGEAKLSGKIFMQISYIGEILLTKQANQHQK